MRRKIIQGWLYRVTVLIKNIEIVKLLIAMGGRATPPLAQAGIVL